jgi:hypothetical protein
MLRTPQLETPEFVEGSPGVQLYEAAHVAVPGRGRDPTGTDLSPKGYDRLDAAAALFSRHNLLGNFVMCGYKTPADEAGKPWTPPPGYLGDLFRGETFQGIPEAISMDWAIDDINPLLHHRFGRLISRGQRRVEPHSINTITNFTEAERWDLFGANDKRPVVIVSQAAHLERILDTIARKTLRRPYMGAVVPESSEPDADSFAARLASQAVLFGISQRRLSAEQMARTAERRSRRVWQGVLAAQGIAHRLRHR